ncbi:phage gp6-like head-tail connector protein [Virgibacillus sp. Bac332]|uniref:phage gp6-like head-tail connector protein n=1 Tax=Virgibacillus sp. Bac332 TaxID=2419842 RepID=UPI000EF4BC20|nr:phage gp6-like head-tail connector protein [Virgibacillus sp. Bac332]
MHISHNEDNNLKRLLSFSISSIKSMCGNFEIDGKTDIDLRAKELVFERTRYAYNDALEYFEANFLTEINTLGLDISFANEDDEDATI